MKRKPKTIGEEFRFFLNKVMKIEKAAFFEYHEKLCNSCPHRPKKGEK